MTERSILPRLARLPIEGIVREYPNAPGLVLTGPQDLKGPRELHPSFYGCFDWHSAVHGHWTLVKLLKQFELEDGAEIRSRLRGNLAEENLAIEVAYLADHPWFERMYGWAWLLRLSQELNGWDDPDGKPWRAAIKPLEDVIVGHIERYLPNLTYPVRVGTHQSTAFALSLIHDYAISCGRDDLSNLVEESARSYFLADRSYPASFEPSGADFLSPALMEAALMSRVLPPDEFGAWLRLFLPDVEGGQPPNLFEPAIVSDMSDPQIGHLIGLNLSRVWCFRRIAGTLAGLAELFECAAASHLEAAVPMIESGHYGGEHWLASFAALAILE